MEYAYIIILSFLIILVAFYIRSLTGFGGAVVSIPLLALMLELKFVVPAEALLEFLFGIVIFRKIYKKMDKVIISYIMCGSVFGVILGAYFLKSFENTILKKALGAVIILFSIYYLMTFNNKYKKVHNLWGTLTGVVGGIFGGLFGTSGPCYVMFLSNQLKSKQVLRATLIGLFTVDFFWRLVVFSYNRLITFDSVKFALLLTPAMIMGSYLGQKTHFGISEVSYKKVVAAVLAFSGIMLLVH